MESVWGGWGEKKIFLKKKEHSVGFKLCVSLFDFQHLLPFQVATVLVMSLTFLFYSFSIRK